MSSYTSAFTPGSWQWPEDIEDSSPELRQRNTTASVETEPEVSVEASSSSKFELPPKPQPATVEEEPEPRAAPSSPRVPPVAPSTASQLPKSKPRTSKGTTPNSQKRYKPRQCRICLESVEPTFKMATDPPPTPPTTATVDQQDATTGATTTSSIPLPEQLRSSLPNFTASLPSFFTSTPRVVYESQEGGRLLRPCLCKGSQAYVHEECLQSWRHADPSYGARHYWQCPTCLYKYRLQRLGWSRWISSLATQISLTIGILVVTTFILGFVADPLINFCLDPYAIIGGSWTSTNTASSMRGQSRSAAHSHSIIPEYHDTWFSSSSKPEPPLADLIDDSWLEHFIKGFASLGLVSFMKVFLSNPMQLFYRNISWGGRGNGTGATGRERMSNTTWILVVIGALSFMYAVWRGVRSWSRRVLERASESVMDVHGEVDSDEDYDDGDDEAYRGDQSKAYGSEETDDFVDTNASNEARDSPVSQGATGD